MNALIEAGRDFVAAILRAVGYMGQPRRRASIRQDLELLRDLERSSEFAQGTAAHQVLVSHIGEEVTRYAGQARRKIPWASITFAAALGAGAGYLTYILNEPGFRWYSLFPATFATLMAIAIIGMFSESAKTTDEDASDQAAN